MSRLLTASILGLSLVAGCKSAGSGEPQEPEVVLFGFDPGMPKKAPADCKKVGKIKASSIGKDSFPEDAMRDEAKAMGANAVTRIKKDGEEDHLLGRQLHFRATAVYCKNLPTAAPVSSQKLEELEPEDDEIHELHE